MHAVQGVLAAMFQADEPCPVFPCSSFCSVSWQWFLEQACKYF